MLWEIQYGDRIDMLLKMAAREGRPPPALANRPQPTRHAAPYLAAFKRLHSSRILGPDGTPAGIPLSEIEVYARMFGFDDLEDRFDLMTFVRVCDDTYMTEMRKRRQPSGKPGKLATGRR